MSQIPAIFQNPSPKWNTDNLMFEHHLAGCCTTETIAEYPTKNEQIPGKFDIPCEMTPDFTDWAYGQMPHALTIRPVAPAVAMCCPEREFDVARDMFGNPVGRVKVVYTCGYQMGCGAADVEFSGYGSEVIKGEMRRSCCYGCLSASDTVTWTEAPNKPYMEYKWISALDQWKYEFCCDVWTGWRGGSDLEPKNEDGDSTVIAYDQSYIHNVCNRYKLWCSNCWRSQNECCSEYDEAPRFGRPMDMRALVSTRYDWELARRDLSTINEELIKYNQQENKQIMTYPPAAGKNVCGLITARLYHDVKCGHGIVRWSDRGAPTPGDFARQAGIDAQYRGSLTHGAPTAEDHLTMLAALVLNAFYTYPVAEGNACGTGFARNIGPAGNVRRGRLMPQGAVSHATTA